MKTLTLLANAFPDVDRSLINHSITQSNNQLCAQFGDQSSGQGNEQPRKRSPRQLLAVSCLVLVVILCWGQAGLIFSKAVLAQYLISKSWENSLATDQQQKPWPWADTWPVLRIQFGNEDQIALAGTNGSSLAFGPGLMFESAEPESGSLALAAHRDTHFSSLQQLHPGNTVRLQTAGGKWFVYRVEGIEVVNSEEVPLLLNHDLRQLKLITCYPFDAIIPGGPLRYVVTAELQST